MKTAMQSNTIRGNLIILAATGAGVYFGVIPPTAGYATAAVAAANIYQRFQTVSPIVKKEIRERSRLRKALVDLGVITKDGNPIKKSEVE